MVSPRKARKADRTRHGGARQHRRRGGQAQRSRWASVRPGLASCPERARPETAGTGTGSDRGEDGAASGARAVLWAICDRLGAGSCAGLVAGHVACEGRGGAAVTWAAVLAGLRLRFLTLLSPVDRPGCQVCVLFYGGDSGWLLGTAVTTDTTSWSGLELPAP